MANFTKKDFLFTQLWAAGEAAARAFDDLQDVDFDEPTFEILKERCNSLQRKVKETRAELHKLYGQHVSGKVLSNEELGVEDTEAIIYCDYNDFCEADI